MSKHTITGFIYSFLQSGINSFPQSFIRSFTIFYIRIVSYKMLSCLIKNSNKPAYKKKKKKNIFFLPNFLNKKIFFFIIKVNYCLPYMTQRRSFTSIPYWFNNLKFEFFFTKNLNSKKFTGSLLSKPG